MKPSEYVPEAVLDRAEARVVLAELLAACGKCEVFNKGMCFAPVSFPPIIASCLRAAIARVQVARRLQVHVAEPVSFKTSPDLPVPDLITEAEIHEYLTGKLLDVVMRLPRKMRIGIKVLMTPMEDEVEKAADDDLARRVQAKLKGNS